MATPRAHLLEPVLAPNAVGQLVAVPGATVWVYIPGTTTPISQTMYSSLTGNTSLANPLTANASGYVEAWVPGPETVDLVTTAPGYTFPTVESKFQPYDGGP